MFGFFPKPKKIIKRTAQTILEEEVRMYANHLVDNWIAVGKSSKPEESNSKTSGEEIVAKHKASGNYKIEIKDDSNTSMPAKSNVKNGTSPESISGCSRLLKTTPLADEKKPVVGTFKSQLRNTELDEPPHFSPCQSKSNEQSENSSKNLTAFSAAPQTVFGAKAKKRALSKSSGSPSGKRKKIDLSDDKKKNNPQ